MSSHWIHPPSSAYEIILQVGEPSLRAVQNGPDMTHMEPNLIFLPLFPL